MDELHRLYEHQTMMAIGIYSFLDNLLSQIPSRSDTEGSSNTEVECPPPTTGTEPNGPNYRTPGSAELPPSLIQELGWSDTFRDRQERIRLLSRFSARSTLEAITPHMEEPSSMGNVPVPQPVEQEDRSIANLEMKKGAIIPGGYAEDLFIYLSEREREEYTCGVCYGILKEPYQCPNEHRFCYGCIYTWSTGPSAGHDACPVCRCDGLYAKNFDIVDRINRKRTRCTKSGCNWMGVLSEHSTHEHRRYTPYELDQLLSGGGRSKTLLPQPLIKKRESETGCRTSPEFHPTTRSDPLRSRTSSIIVTNTTRNVGQCPTTCAPLENALTEHTSAEQPRESTPHGLTRLRRSLQQSRGRANRTTANRISPNQHHPLTHSLVGGHQFNHMRRQSNRTSPSRLYSRHSSQSRFRNREQHHLIHPASTERMSPGVDNPLSPIRRSTSPRGAAAGSPTLRTDELDCIVRYPSSLNRSVSSISHRVTYESHRFPLRYSSRISASPEPIASRDPVSPPPTIATDAHASDAYIAARNALYSRGGTRRTPILPHISDDPQPTNTTDNNANFSLPAINQNGNVTSSIDSRPLHRNTQVQTMTESFDPLPTENANAEILSTPVIEPRPMEFRRLVPRRPSRVVEQLRETREQLAAMLRLMTLELEERRQHVLAATLETAARGRVLRQLNEQLSRETTTFSTQDSEQDIDTPRTESTEPSYLQEQQTQRNQLSSGCMNILRNLPTPDRPNQRTSLSHLPLQNLTNRMLGTRIYHYEREPLLLTEVNQRRSLLSSIDNLTNEDITSQADSSDWPLPFTSGRLLNRLRIGAVSYRRPSRPYTDQFGNGHRHLSHLLSEIHYPRTSINHWSSDDDDDDDDVDAGNNGDCDDED